jgi:hypothetical protein
LLILPFFKQTVLVKVQVVWLSIFAILTLDDNWVKIIR